MPLFGLLYLPHPSLQGDIKMKYQCNNCKKEFDIPGELETQITSYQPLVQQQGTIINIPLSSVTSTIIRKAICPYFHQLDFHEIKED